MPRRPVGGLGRLALPPATRAATSARETIRWTRERGFDPAPQPPRAVHHAGRRPADRRLLGVPRRAGRDRARPGTLGPPSGLEGPRGRRGRRAARAPGRRPGPTSRAGRGHRQPSAVPRVPRPRRVEGPGGAQARPPARDPARADPGDGRPVQRLRDDRDGRPRRGDAVGARRRSRPVARYVAPPLEDEGAAEVIGALVLAAVGRHRRTSGRCSARRRGARGREPTASVSRRRGRPGARDRGAPPRGARRPADRHGLRDRRRARRRRAGSSGCSPRSERPPDKGDRAARSRTTIRPTTSPSSTPPLHVLAAAFWPGALTLVVRAACRRPAPRGADRRRADDRAPAAGPRRPARACRRASARCR